MAYLGKYIRQILSRKEEVVFPGFGSLMLKEGKGIPGDGLGIDPPGIVIKFDATHPKGDGKLAEEYAQGEGLEFEEARQQVLELVDAIKFKLDKGEKYKLDLVGEFSRDDDNRIHFMKDYNWVLDPELFGLATLDLLELEAEEDSREDSREDSLTVAESSVVESDSSSIKASKANRAPVNKWRIIWIVVASLFAVLVAILLIPSGNSGVEFGREGIVFKDTVQEDVSGLREGMDGEASDGIVQSEEVGEQSDATDGAEQVHEGLDVGQENMGDLSGGEVQSEDKFFIIAGSFQSIMNAKELQEELIAKGFDSQIIATEGNLYRVAVEGYVVKQDAVNALPAIRRETGKAGAWVFSR